MKSRLLNEFLESSTIHGLARISTAKSKAKRAAWVAIVVACFAIAINMITNSYQEWHKSPVSTTISTHPITELEFPTVTVCPPRGSNTVLNHLLEKVSDVNYTRQERNDLLNMLTEVFVRNPNEQYAKLMSELLSIDNMRGIANGQISHPEIDQNQMITIKSSELEGSFMTPGMDVNKYEGDFYNRSHSLHYVLNFPDNIEELVGKGVLVISPRGKFRYRLQDKQLQVYKKRLNMSSAEKFCVSRGGHLASVTSGEEMKKLASLAKGSGWFWLGGKQFESNNTWYWLDGRPWGYSRFSSRPGGKCLKTNGAYWFKTKCDSIVPKAFVCSTPVTEASGDIEIILKRTFVSHSTFHFWWNHREGSLKKRRGFKLTWWIENGNMPVKKEFVSKNLSGTISTPGVGSPAPPGYFDKRHEYTAIIEMPFDIKDKIADKVLVVDLDITFPDNQQSENGVEYSTLELNLELNKLRLNWTSAEASCVEKGGHLASAPQADHWRRIKSFLYDDDFSNCEKFWLGGKENGTEGNWTWTDGSQWSYEHWYEGEPNDEQNQNCLQADSFYWYDSSCSNRFCSICSFYTKMTMKTDTMLVLTSENISMHAMQFTWFSQKSQLVERNSARIQQGTSNLTKQTGPSSKIGGFSLKWHLQGSTANNDTRESKWRTKLAEDRNLLAIMNLVRQSKVQGIQKEVVWDWLYWIDEYQKKGCCLNASQIAEVIVDLGFYLGKIEYDWYIRITEKDIEFGTQIYSALLFCPIHFVENRKINAFFKTLLPSKGGRKSELNSLVAATFHSLLPKPGNIIKDFTALNMWYEALGQKYNFSLGPTILGLVTTDGLDQLAKHDVPFFKKYKTYVKNCLNAGDCHKMEKLIGKSYIHCDVLKKDQRGHPLLSPFCSKPHKAVAAMSAIYKAVPFSRASLTILRYEIEMVLRALAVWYLLHLWW